MEKIEIERRILIIRTPLPENWFSIFVIISASNLELSNFSYLNSINYHLNFSQYAKHLQFSIFNFMVVLQVYFYALYSL